MADRHDLGGTTSDIPWVSVFDPAVNVRALGEIQTRGFQAASELVDRFVRIAGAAGSPEAATGGDAGQTAPAPASGRTAPQDVERLMAFWQRLGNELTGTLQQPTNGHAGSPAFDFAADRATGAARLEAAAASPVSTEVWLHNPGPLDLGMVKLRSSDLMSHDGSVIAADAVRFEPDAVHLVSRSSRGVVVTVDVPEGLGVGCYRGTLFVDGNDEAWLPVSLRLTSTSA